ncbi:MAG TPA: DUF3145 domain-containing protein [Actinobacteria bacterium]|nr:DUF3145 domain-containing protein [Actinomycetota bacterium]
MMAHGVVFIHAAPTALAPHVEWAISTVLGTRADLDWTPQAAAPGHVRCEFTWEGEAGTGAKLASAFRGWPRMFFEALEDPCEGREGERFASTPTLGLFRGTTNAIGDILIHEDRLRAAVARAVAEDRDLVEEIERLLGQPWDEELEPLRWAGEGAPIRVLHQVV